MKLIVCIDDKGTMAFNHRRQTRDIVQRQHMNRLLQGSRVYMTAYSGKLFFKDLPDALCVITDDLDGLPEGNDDFIFVERDEPLKTAEKASKIYIYRWNRSYPGDVYFPLNLLDDFKLVRKENFEGHSHDEITFEVYER